MKISQNSNWVSADLQARIDPPNILLVDVEPEYQLASKIIKVEMWRKLATATSEKYNINMYTFKDCLL